MAEDSLKILDAIRRITKADMVVDSSKDPMGLLPACPKTSIVRLIFLQRSIDELAYSKMKHREASAWADAHVGIHESVGRQNRSIREVVDQVQADHVHRLTARRWQDPRGEIRKILDFLSFGSVPDQLLNSLEPQETTALVERRPGFSRVQYTMTIRAPLIFENIRLFPI